MQHGIIGTGPIGYSAIGLDLVGNEVLGRLALPPDAEVTVEVPAFTVIAADVFDAFMARNHIEPSDLQAISDRQIVRRFIGGELPAGLADDLAELASELDGPLVVRPSSVLEASLERSFGGVYSAKVLPNSGDDLPKRARRLADAIRLVWASTYFAEAVSWRLGAGRSREEERMAVVVQRAVGSRIGGLFYPTVSMVARSYNHYPAPGNEPGEGVVTVAMGFGRAISEGHAWSYCPARPTAPPPFKNPEDMLKYSQTGFWAVDLDPDIAPKPTREDEFMVRLGLADAERHGSLDLLASTYDAESDRLRPGCDGDSARVLTFAPLLGSSSIPFTSVVKEILDQARAVTGREVEIELAASLDPETGVPIRFGIVQLKTMAGWTAAETLDTADLTAEGVVVASEACLGNGVRVDLVDLVYLKPEAFDRHQTRTITSELDAVNRGLLEEGRSAIFIGFGRWGTTDDRFGVPVRWGQISSAQVVVEITLPDAPMNLSQGTHFFHHILSQKVLYLSVAHDAGNAVNFAWLADREPVWEGRYVRHVRVDEPVEVRVDGGNRRGVIRDRAG